MLRDATRINFRDAVVVVTGASAGVGRASARRFARLGAKVALIGRDAAALEAARSEVEATGGRAIALPLDVADADAVFAAADAIEAQLGPIDVWVNNAMVTLFSTIEDLTPEEVRRVTEVTYLGTVHGTMAALRHMRKRDAGVIVQVGSSLAYRGIPLQSAYCAAKHAVRGFTDSLRAELLHDRSRIEVTMVQLPAVNTPQFDWARTKRAKLPRPVAPVYATATAARAIERAARQPVREYWVGGGTLLTILGNMLLPQLADRILARAAVEGQERDAPVPADRRDNLFAPVSGLHRTDGPFGAESRPSAMLVPAPPGRIGAVALVAGLAFGLGGVLLGRAIAAATTDGQKRIGQRG